MAVMQAVAVCKWWLVSFGSNRCYGYLVFKHAAHASAMLQVNMTIHNWS
jgi:hypothetical protein